MAMIVDDQSSMEPISNFLDVDDPIDKGHIQQMIVDMVIIESITGNPVEIDGYFDRTVNDSPEQGSAMDESDELDGKNSGNEGGDHNIDNNGGASNVSINGRDSNTINDGGDTNNGGDGVADDGCSEGEDSGTNSNNDTNIGIDGVDSVGSIAEMAKDIFDESVELTVKGNDGGDSDGAFLELLEGMAASGPLHERGQPVGTSELWDRSSEILDEYFRDNIWDD